MVHRFKIPSDSLLIYAILESNLAQGLLALHIDRFYLVLISANATVKTASTVLAFIPLSAASQAIPDHI